MLLNLIDRALLLHLQRKDNIQILSLAGSLLIITVDIELRVVGILHVVACMVSISLYVDTLLQELRSEGIHYVVFTLQVNHRTGLTHLVDHKQRGDTGILSHLGVVGTKGRSDMHDTCTIIGSHIVSGNHAESLILHLDKTIITHGKDLLGMILSGLLNELCGILIQTLTGLYPGHQLTVSHTDEVRTLILSHDAVRNYLVTGLVLIHIGKLSLWFEVGIHQLGS